MKEVMVSLWILLLLSNAAAFDLETVEKDSHEGLSKIFGEAKQVQKWTEQLKKEKSALTEEVSSLNEEREKLNKENGNLKEENSNLKEDNRKLNQENIHLETNVNTMREQNSTLTTSVLNLQKDEHNLKEKNKQRDTEVKQLEQDEKKLNDKVTTLRTSVSKLQNEKNNLDPEVKQLEKEKKKLNDEVNDLKETSKTLDDENAKVLEHNQKLKSKNKELIKEIVSSYGQSQENIIISVVIAWIISLSMSASWNVKQYMNAKSESEGQEKKKKRKDDLSLFSDDEDDNEEEYTSKNQPGFEEDKENAQLSGTGGTEEANSRIQLRFEEQNTRNQTKVVEYFENLKQKFALALDLQTEWQNMTVGETKKWDLWHLTKDDLLVVTRISMERTVNKEKLPAVTVSLKQGKGSVPPVFIHTLRKTKKKTRALSPPIVQMAFGSLDSWTGE